MKKEIGTKLKMGATQMLEDCQEYTVPILNAVLTCNGASETASRAKYDYSTNLAN